MTYTDPLPREGGRAPEAGTKFYAYSSLLVIGVLVAVPLLGAALGGFKTLGELHVNPIGLPQTWVLDNFVSILTDAGYWRMMANSLVIAVLTVVLTLIISSAAAFCLAQMRFRSRGALLSFFVIGLLFPADILEAAAWIRGQALVASDKIYVIGWSYGGGGVLAALKAMPPGPPLLAKAVTYYPDCRRAIPWSSTSVSVLMLNGRHG